MARRKGGKRVPFTMTVEEQMASMGATRDEVEEARRLAVSSGLFRKTLGGYERREVVKGVPFEERWYAAPEVDLVMRLITLVVDTAELSDDDKARISLDELTRRLKATPEEIAQVTQSKAFLDLIEVERSIGKEDVYRPRLELVPEDYDDPEKWPL
jgi:hypothetical protein